MKLEKNPKYFTIAIYSFLVIAASIVFYLIATNAGGLFGWAGNVVTILQPVVIGFVLAYLLNPLLRLFDDRLLPRVFKGKHALRSKVKRGISIGLTYIVAIIVVSLFIAIVIPQLVVSVKSIVAEVPGFVRIVSDWYNDIVAQLRNMQVLGDSAQSANMVEWLLSAVQGMIDNLMEQLTKLAPTVWFATTKITTGVLNATLGLIISIYLLYDREKLFAQLKKIVAAICPQQVSKVLTDIISESHRIFSGFIVGKIIDSIIIGILCFIGMIIFRMEYAVLISVIVGVTNVIPYFGPFIGAIPGALVLYLVNPSQAFWFCVFIFLLQQFDGNILGPKILGDTIGLSAFWVVFSITLFSGIFGFMGMFIGVPLFALIYYIAKKFIAYILERKGESADTRDYDSDVNPLLK